MFRLIFSITLLAASCNAAIAANYQELFGHEPQNEKLQALVGKFDFQQGTVKISSANITLNVPDNYYYLDSEDTATVLQELWGNPPEASQGTLGMLFPVNYPPEHPDAWGSIIEFSKDGYVSDEDADSIDYDELLTELREGVRANNEDRIKAGYEPIELVGWASPPFYDKQAHTLHWARDIKFGVDENAQHTLNYQLRKLGRLGVVELNFVAALEQLPEIKANIPATIAMMSYDTGSKYSDFREGDKVAAYGLAGLIAAGAGAKLAAKAGILAVVLAFLKKGIVLIIPIFLVIGNFFKNLFRKNKGGEAAAVEMAEQQGDQETVSETDEEEPTAEDK